MKQLTLKALNEHFQKGATARQLLRFFKDAWGRDDVVRSSLSPQLTRLKNDGKIRRDGIRWFLVTTEKNEAHRPGSPAGASETGEAATSLNDSRSRSANPFD